MRHAKEPAVADLQEEGGHHESRTEGTENEREGERDKAPGDHPAEGGVERESALGNGMRVAHRSRCRNNPSFP